MRPITVVLVLFLFSSACQGDGVDTTTSSPTTTTTTTTSTTTTVPTTTTLPPEFAADLDPSLVQAVRALYSIPQGGDPPNAPEPVVAGFSEAADASPPSQAEARVGVVGESIRLAVVVAGDDATLLVGDPDWRVVGGWWPSHGVGPYLGPFPKVVAVVGSDARPGQDRDTALSDSIHLVSLDGAGSAAIVGIPRDSWVGIPGHGNRKINAALSLGGPGLMMETFTSLTGLEFDGYLLTGFAGFRDLVAVLGAVEIDVPLRLNDASAGARFEPGLQRLHPWDALAFARARKTLPRGDFDRQAHGGLLLISAANILRAWGVLELPSALEKSESLYSTDLTPEERLLLAASVIRVDPAQVDNVVADGGVGSVGGASVVFLRDGAFSTFADMADGRLGDG